VASDIKVNGQTTGQTLYAVVENGAGQIWNTAPPGFEAPMAANIASYAVAMTEEALPGRYRGNFPTGITLAGKYNVAVYQRAGATPVTTDPFVGASDVEWTGAVDLTSTATQARVLTALPATAAAAVGGLVVAPNVANSVLVDTANIVVDGSITLAKMWRGQLAINNGSYTATWPAINTAGTATVTYNNQAGTTEIVSTLTVDSSGRPTGRTETTFN